MKSLNLARRELATTNLELANEVRHQRVELRRALAVGAIKLGDVIHDKRTEKMAIFDLLLWVPGVGPSRARNILWAQMIGERRRCFELTLRQKAALVVLVAEVQR